MTFESVYASAWHHPGLAWVLCAVALPMVWRVRDVMLRRVLLGFVFTTALDAWLTGGLSPLTESSLLARNVSIAFVIWGDVRMWVLLEKFRGDATWSKAWLRAVPLAFVVPVVQAIAIRAWPDAFIEPRRIYLVYEAAFVLLASGLLVLRYPRAWAATSLLGFFLVQYALWVVSDVLILSGHTWAYGLRLVPNALYYGLFLLFAARRLDA